MSTQLSSVRIVGSGLIGTSIGLGLVQQGVAVEMVDADLKAQALANDLVGGVEVVDPELVVLAMPTSQLSADRPRKSTKPTVDIYRCW